MKLDVGRWKVQLLVLWTSLTASAVVYVVLAHVVQRGRGDTPMPNAEQMAGTFETLSLVLPFVLLVIGMVAYRAVARRGADTSPSDPEEASALLQVACRQVQSGMIVMLALFEVAAIVGILGVLLSGSLGLIHRLAGATIVLNVIGLTWVLQDVGRVTELARRAEAGSE